MNNEDGVCVVCFYTELSGLGTVDVNIILNKWRKRTAPRPVNSYCGPHTLTPELALANLPKTE